MTVNVTLTEQPLQNGTTVLKLATPYSPALPAKCRALGGKWYAESKTWRFDVRDARRVSALCLEIFGLDPLAEPGETPELVTVRLELDSFDTHAASFWSFGREIVSRGGRDYPVRLGDGVIVVSGGFPGHGGSVKNPALNTQDGTILEVRDVPRSLVDELLAKRGKRVVELQAAIVEYSAAIATMAQELADLPEPIALGSEAMYTQNRLRRDHNDVIAKLVSAKSALKLAEGGITIVDAAPEPTRVAPAIQQIVALAKTLDPAGRRSAIMSVLAALESAERQALLTEIQQYLSQGAL